MLSSYGEATNKDDKFGSKGLLEWNLKQKKKKGEKEKIRHLCVKALCVMINI